MTTELKTNTSLVEQFREDPEKVKRTIEDLINQCHHYDALLNMFVSTEELRDLHKENLENELDLYKSLFTWNTSFEIGGRYQLPTSVNVCLKFKSEKDFTAILQNGYEGSLEPQRYDDEQSPSSIEYEYADLLFGDFHCLDPEVRVENLAIKEGN